MNVYVCNMILLDLYIIIIDFYSYFNYKFGFLYIIHVIQSSNCEVFFLINDSPIYLIISENIYNLNKSKQQIISI